MFPLRPRPNEDDSELLAKIFCLDIVGSFDIVENEAGRGIGMGNILLFSNCWLLGPLLLDGPAEFRVGGDVTENM